jgi:hypothetical protein
MIEPVIAFIVNESKWLTVSLGLALAAVTVLLVRGRRASIPVRQLTLAAMNLFFGVTIGTMAFGHLLAVTTKLAIGTLEGSVALFYLIGVALAAPAWSVIAHTRRVLRSAEHGRATLVLNAWLAFTLLALGPQNLPLAAPGLLNIGYHLHQRRAVGWAIVGVATFVNVGLLIGSVIFFASGQSFEQFRGMQ